VTRSSAWSATRIHRGSRASCSTTGPQARAGPGAADARTGRGPATERVLSPHPGLLQVRFTTFQLDQTAMSGSSCRSQNSSPDGDELTITGAHADWIGPETRWARLLPFGTAAATSPSRSLKWPLPNPPGAAFHYCRPLEQMPRTAASEIHARGRRPRDQSDPHRTRPHPGRGRGTPRRLGLLHVRGRSGPAQPHARPTRQHCANAMRLGVNV
jgi:hypothetical protein